MCLSKRLGARLAAKIFGFAAWFLALINFWVFSRFTVDDAFITWRYGQNLVNHGIWNYNPTTFDPTQAYTNPIYALISIAPAYFGFNMVLFFKLFAMICAIGFIIWFIRERPSANVPLALFFAVPATMIHIFSGLETFLFVVGVFAVFISVQEKRFALAMVATSLLFLTRPESWLLGLLVPVALSVNLTRRFRLKVDLKTFFFGAAILGSVLFSYFAFHAWSFGELLPNTFFVKSGRNLQAFYLLNLSIILLPLVGLFLAGWRRVSVFALLFFIPLILNYSSSSMGMDYASRYAFHIYAPFALFGIYVLTSTEGQQKLNEAFGRYSRKGLNKILATSLALGFLVPTIPQNIFPLANYYPRLLDAQGQIGFLAKDSAKAMSIGDSGLAPFLAGVPNLDLTLLGTKLGAVNGISRELFDAYGVDFVAVRDRQKLVEMMKPILTTSQLVHVCDVYFGRQYRLQLWLPESTMQANKVCSSSQAANDVDDYTYLWANVTKAPWIYWH